MSFFDSARERPTPSFEAPGNPAWMRPDGVIPGPAPAELFLIRNNEVAVAMGSVRAYPNGFEFTVHARLRHKHFVWGRGPLDSLADPRTEQVHPLPPDGPVTFVASWLLYEVPETRAELDSSVIHEAAGRAVILWPHGP